MRDIEAVAADVLCTPEPAFEYTPRGRSNEPANEQKARWKDGQAEGRTK